MAQVDDTGLITAISAESNPTGSVKTTKRKFTWLPNIDELVPLRLLDFDYIITKEKIEDGDDF